jgi:hypothetical protein
MADVKTTLDNIVAHWKLDEASGTRVDETTNNNDLTDNNTVAQATGKINDAADFEASQSEYLSITDGSQTGLDFTGDFSVSMWFKLESAVTGWQPMISKDDGQPNRSYFFGLRDVSGDNYEWVISTAGTNATTNHYRAAAGSTFSTGVWYHLVMAYDASAGTIACYLDGSLDATITGAPSSIYNSGATFEMGSYTLNSLYFDGILDEVTLTSDVITSGEASTLYNSGNGLEWEDAGTVVTPNTLSIASSAISPSVSGAAIVSPTTQAITSSSISPTVVTGSTIAIGTQVITSSIISPAVDAGGNTTVSVGTQTVSVVAVSPTVSVVASVTVAATTQSIASSVVSPTITADINTVLTLNTQVIAVSTIPRSQEGSIWGKVGWEDTVDDWNEVARTE